MENCFHSQKARYNHSFAQKMAIQPNIKPGKANTACQIQIITRLYNFCTVKIHDYSPTACICSFVLRRGGVHPHPVLCIPCRCQTPAKGRPCVGVRHFSIAQARPKCQTPAHLHSQTTHSSSPISFSLRLLSCLFPSGKHRRSHYGYQLQAHKAWCLFFCLLHHKW